MATKKKKPRQHLKSTGSGPTADKNLNQVSQPEVPDVLGPERAFKIVTDCAGETDLTKKLGEIPGLDLVIFQSCVQTGIISNGYKPGNIPASPGTTLSDVLQAIQGCTK
jgi:hypothetical protein